MANSSMVNLLLLLLAVSFTQALTYCSDGAICTDDEYCCGAGLCCQNYDYPDVWGLWYFWLILIFVLSIVMSCIGCCVRAARRRQVQRRYVRIVPPVQRTYGTQVVITHNNPPGYAYQTAPSVHSPPAPPAYKANEEAPPSYQ